MQKLLRDLAKNKLSGLARFVGLNTLQITPSLCFLVKFQPVISSLTADNWLLPTLLKVLPLI